MYSIQCSSITMLSRNLLIFPLPCLPPTNHCYELNSHNLLQITVPLLHRTHCCAFQENQMSFNTLQLLCDPENFQYSLFTVCPPIIAVLQFFMLFLSPLHHLVTHKKHKQWLVEKTQFPSLCLPMSVFVQGHRNISQHGR